MHDGRIISEYGRIVSEIKSACHLRLKEDGRLFANSALRPNVRPKLRP